jgi:hypothetical protein
MNEMLQIIDDSVDPSQCFSEVSAVFRVFSLLRWFDNNGFFSLFSRNARKVNKTLIKHTNSHQNNQWQGIGCTHAEAGDTATFIVHSRDALGSNLVVGGCTVVATVSGPANMLVTVIDRQDGSYQCSYTPIKAGVYRIDVRCESQPISASPLTVTVVGFSRLSSPPRFLLLSNWFCGGVVLPVNL